jgi:hypothetical protein
VQKVRTDPLAPDPLAPTAVLIALRMTVKVEHFAAGEMSNVKTRLRLLSHIGMGIAWLCPPLHTLSILCTEQRQAAGIVSVCPRPRPREYR